MLKSTWQVIRPFVIVGTILGCILTGLLLAKISELRPKSAALRAEAIERYSGDDVIALARFVDDPGISFHRRNYAIGMLANLGDIRALPVLEKHYTGADCHHWYFLCQYELKNAVTRCRADLGKSILFRLLDVLFS
jgi:hypothetical protein